ncbi:MAG: hypothetical protein ACOYJG_03305 [Prevotella sp.]|jgi:hypothetical protein
MKSRKIIISIVFLLFSIAVWSQNVCGGFNPQQFEMELEKYIENKVRLTPKESAAFFPLYEEMRAKQRVYFQRDKQNRHVNPNDSKACEKAVREHDENELQLKRIQQSYHNKFMKILPANKVYQIIKAEKEFHKKKFRRAVRNRRR